MDKNRPDKCCHSDSWDLFKKVIRVTESYPKKLLKKLYLQAMQGCSELEGISYQTSILRIKKLLLRRKLKKNLLSENLKVLGLKAKN